MRLMRRPGVLDELELRPGALDDFLVSLEAEYRPVAEARGMQLRHRWVTPPVELPNRGSTVLLVWALEGVAGFWGMRSQSGREEVAAWWERCDALVTARGDSRRSRPSCRRSRQRGGGTGEHSPVCGRDARCRQLRFTEERSGGRSPRCSGSRRRDPALPCGNQSPPELRPLRPRPSSAGAERSRLSRSTFQRYGTGA